MQEKVERHAARLDTEEAVEEEPDPEEAEEDPDIKIPNEEPQDPDTPNMTS